jgi:type IV secretion system protein VirB10
MRLLTVLGLMALSSQFVLCEDFSGPWRLNPAKSQIRSRFDIPSGFLRITQNASIMTVSASTKEGQPSTTVVYPVDGPAEKSQADGLTFSIATKWEGDALLANIIVGGQSEYSLSERWVRVSPGTLTLTRTVQDRNSTAESVLFYEYADQIVLWGDERPPVPLVPSPHTEGLKLPVVPPADFVLQPGTRILLRLTNAIDTKHSAPGDRIYLQTAAPVFLNGRIIVPQGSYVTGTVTESNRAGRIKGKSGINFRFETLTLPNGATRDFRSRAGSVDGQGNLDRDEGRITGDGTIGKDAGTVAKTTAAGTGIGTIAGAAAGHLGMGMGIGAAAGAVGGLAGVFGSRGKDVTIPQGTTMEMVLDRELRFTDAELSAKVR